MINLTEIQGIANIAASISTTLAIAVPTETDGFRPQLGFENTESELSEEILVFDVQEDQSIDVDAEITDHYTEDGSITDNISFRPEIIVTNGLIGELTTQSRTKTGRSVEMAIEKAGQIASFLPNLSASALAVNNRAISLIQSTEKIERFTIKKWASLNKSSAVVFTGAETPEELSEKIKNAKNQTYQAEAFQKIYGYMKQRKLFTVHTPWGVFKNCAIQKLRAVQDSESKDVSSFQVIFKSIRIAEVSFSSSEELGFNPRQATGVTSQQGAIEVNKGTSSLGANTSFLNGASL